MTPDDFIHIAELLKRRSGLALSKDKIYLIESRLQPVARLHGFAHTSALIQSLTQNPDPRLVHEVVQAMTTNETMFFRDIKPFAKFREKVLPHWLEQNTSSRHLRIWSAACSSGQEPYTVSMCLQEEAGRLSGASHEIIASDLCEKVVEKAAKGVYTQFEVQRGLPIQFLLKYFHQEPENSWRVSDATKRQVQFQTHNLMEDCSKFGMFDIIFCRNVLIYFDQPTKEAVLERLACALKPPGYLILGSAETIFGLKTRFQSFENEPGIYILKP